MLWKKPLFLWPFSIAMLNYQRVWLRIKFWRGNKNPWSRQHRLVGRPAVSNHPQSQFQSEPPRRDHRVHEYQMEYQMEALWSFDETNDQAGILKNQKISMHPKDPKETRNRPQKFPYTFVWKFPDFAQSWWSHDLEDLEDLQVTKTFCSRPETIIGCLVDRGPTQLIHDLLLDTTIQTSVAGVAATVLPHGFRRKAGIFHGDFYGRLALEKIGINNLSK